MNRKTNHKWTMFMAGLLIASLAFAGCEKKTEEPVDQGTLQEEPSSAPTEEGTSKEENLPSEEGEKENKEEGEAPKEEPSEEESSMEGSFEAEVARVETSGYEGVLYERGEKMPLNPGMVVTGEMLFEKEDALTKLDQEITEEMVETMKKTGEILVVEYTKMHTTPAFVTTYDAAEMLFVKDAGEVEGVYGATVILKTHDGKYLAFQ